MRSFSRNFRVIESLFNNSKSKIMNYKCASSNPRSFALEPNVPMFGRGTAASFLQQPANYSQGRPFPLLLKCTPSATSQAVAGTHNKLSTSYNGRPLVSLFYKSPGHELFRPCMFGSTAPIRFLTTRGDAAEPVAQDSSSVSPETVRPIKFKRPDKTARHIMQILDKEAVEAVKADREIPDIKPGYTVQLKVEVPENKRRVSTLKGIVIARRNAGLNSTFRLRRLVAGVGVESVFPLYSPNIKEFKVLDKKVVRKAKLYYLRDRMNALRK